MLEHLKIAVIHEWFVDYSGSERVVEQILKIFPHADLFATVDFLPDRLRGFIQHKKVHATFIQNLPFARTKFRSYLPLMPLAIEQLDLSSYDLIISSCHAVAKGVLTGPDQLHIAYVHSPIRYAWDLQHQYLKESDLERGIKSWLARWFLHQIRLWDCRTANGVDHFVANSNFIARRIQKVYRREARVIYPPVDVAAFSLNQDLAKVTDIDRHPEQPAQGAIAAIKKDFYLTASRFVPYKKVDLIVAAFRQMPSKQLLVIGDGPNLPQVQALAQNCPNITLIGYQPPEKLKTYMQQAKAFVFAAEEDFGITPVEALAAGTPVIAYGKGGVLETVIGLDHGHAQNLAQEPLRSNNRDLADGEQIELRSPKSPTGIFFRHQTVNSLVTAVEKFELSYDEISSACCNQSALRYAPARFRQEFADYVNQVCTAHFGDRLGS
ncbi:glycosyl transferase group 1 [Thalassoporum mexicanum PCC 7367]|uniref:glycosyltransferase family 4 protein n=1 Tax=Thalassoporum mexicanum TaxID=3457544 RepID=UPI00029F932A|nr:glycosyltransferase family 4 protein [Pseudanabaena sp. PCC 7367]AFY71292.1 glycosyl transferase group 1 [Pseudanabaena sp. PCC 7367]